MNSCTTYRSVYENKDLGQWLLQLVAHDADQRKIAAKVVRFQFHMPGDLELSGLEPDRINALMSAHLEQFQRDLRATLARPDFPAADFVCNLLALDLALQESLCAKIAADSAREEEAGRADRAKMGEYPTEAEKRRYIRRVWIRLLRDCKRINEEESHERLTTGITLSDVIDLLGAELLPAADILREMLLSKHKADVASGAIGRMGRAGMEFYGDLLSGLQRNDPNFYCSRALGNVLKAVPERIPEILRLACEPGGDSQVAALYAIAVCGRAATEAFPEVEIKLRNLLETNPEEQVWYRVVAALGAGARTSQTVDSLLARLAPADQVKCGGIMLALGEMGIDSERVVPRLAELLNTFKEYDPDWCYHGEHERVVQALRGFGLSAVSAIPSLIRHVWTTPQQYWTRNQTLAERPEPDEGVIKLLGEFGPLAKEALPALQGVRDKMRERSAESDDSNGSETSAAEDEDTCWVAAIKRIQGTETDTKR